MTALCTGLLLVSCTIMEMDSIRNEVPRIVDL